MIDELIHHCIQEIGADGEAGSEIDRIYHFIHDFHAQQSSTLPRQNVDGAYKAFVLKLLLQHPDVQIGLHTPVTPVKNARKGNITRKAENNGVASRAEDVTAPTHEFDWVDPLPSAQHQLPIKDLQQKYHDKLRLVLTSSLIKRLLLGPGDYNLSTPNYRFLQLVYRARQNAVKSVDLGTIMRYDQRTIFYLAKKLIDLNLIAKIKAPETGTSASYFVAVKYMHMCPLLLDQQNADIATDRDARPPFDSRSTGDVTLDAEDLDVEADLDAPVVKVEQGETETALTHFEPVSPDKALVWVSSRPELVRLRIYLLCNQTESKITARIGVTKRIRMQGALKRPMVSLLEQAVKNGYFEVVRVFLSNSSSNDAGYKGLRMTAKGEAEMTDLLNGNNIDSQQQEQIQQARKRNAQLSHELAMREPRLVREVTLERWLHEQVAKSGSSGKSLKQLASSIHASGHVHRILEGIIQRSEEADADPSMADLRIRSVHEHNLRVRSTRFFSQHAWVLQCANEGYLQDSDRDLLQVSGGSSTVHEHETCWETVEQLAATVSGLASDLHTPVSGSKPAVKRGRPLGSTKKRPAEEVPAVPKKRGRPRKHPQIDEPSATPTAATDAEGTRDVNITDASPIPSPIQTAVPQTIPTDESTSAAASLSDTSRIRELLQTPVKQEPSALSNSIPTPRSAPAATPQTARKARTNLTRLRSAHAIVDCIKQAGGAVDSLLIPKALLAYGEEHGYAADSQLLNLRDKRVRDRALASAIDDGMLRRVHIRLERPEAHQPQRQIIYLPELDSEKLKQYCDAVLAGDEGWTLVKSNPNTALMHITDKVSLDVGDAGRWIDRKPWHTQEPVTMDELPSDPRLLATLRDHFVTVPSVFGQHIGHLGGPMLRLKVFHMACTQLIASQHELTSQNPPSIQLSYFWTQAPLDLFLALVSVRSPTQAVEAALLDTQLRSRPVQELGADLQAALRLPSTALSDVTLVFYSLAVQLADLGIALPADNTRTEVVQLKRYLPLYEWGSEDDEKSLIEVMDVGCSAESIRQFWSRTQKLCLQPKSSTPIAASESVQEHQDVDLVRKVPEELKQAMPQIKAWRPYNTLRPSQTRFLDRIDLGSLRDGVISTDIVAHLAYITLVPTRVIAEYLENRKMQAAEAAATGTARSRNVACSTWPLRLSVIDVSADSFVPVVTKANKPARATEKSETERDQQGRMTTLKKARELRQKREEQFQQLIDQAFDQAPGAQLLRDKIERALRGIRKRFISGDARFSNADEVRKVIHRAVSSGAGIKIRMPSVKAATATTTNGVAAAKDIARPEGKLRQQRTGRRALIPTNYWDATKNELLRDCAAILRVRDRARGRTDWSALMQVVDPADQNKSRGSVLSQWRNQYQKMRFIYGEEGYLSSLERHWSSLSSAARESGELFDPNFPSANDFDLKAQIAFLRKHIDKNEIQSSLAKPATKDPLPLTLTAANDFTKGWQPEFPTENSERKWEVFFSNELGMSAKRFEVLLSQALGSESVSDLRASSQQQDREEIIRDKMAEMAVRIVISTEAESEFDQSQSPSVDTGSSLEELKTAFCEEVGSVEIEAAIVRLLESKLIRPLTVEIGSRRRPGTNFTFTDEYLRLLPDPVSNTQTGPGSKISLLELQKTLRDKYKLLSDTSRSWLVEPVETDGDAAAMVSLMDLGVVQSKLDLRPFTALRQHHAFNARVLNDDELETLMTIEAQNGCGDVIAPSSKSLLPPIPTDDAVLEWLDKPDDEWRAAFPATHTALRDMLSEAGIAGIPLSSAELQYSDLLYLLSGSRPLAFLSPISSTPTLVGSSFVQPYTFVFPQGRRIPHVWSTLTKPSTQMWGRLVDHIVGFVLQRPGTNVTHLANRFTTGRDTGISFLDVHLAVRALVERQILELTTLNTPDPRGWILHLHPQNTSSSIWTGFTHSS